MSLEFMKPKSKNTATNILLISFIFLYGISMPVIAQEIKGQVTDQASGETLPGVNIILKGTTAGTSTDAQGRYSLNATSLNDTLVFSFIGYQTREVPIEGRNEINVALTSQAVVGEDIVVVGYGTQKSKDIISGISTVDTEQLGLVDQPTPSAVDLLKGRVAGVNIRETTGATGSTPVIQVRGLSSINAGVEPLVVIDGFPVGNSFPQSLNPDDIGNMTVLKDAAATAIYGARGSNGVVLIETINAREGQNDFSYNTHVGIQQVPENWRPNMLNAVEYTRFNRERIEELDAINNTSTPIPQVFLDVLDNPEQYGDGTDWLDTFFREGTGAFSQNHNLTYKNGNERFRTVISGGYSRNNGVVPNDNFQRLSLRTKLDVSLSDRIKMGVNLSAARTDNNRTDTDGARSTLWAAVVGSPLQSPYDQEGNLKKYMPGDTPGYFAMPNPIFEAKATKNLTVSRNLQANIDFDIELMEGLHYTPRFFGRQLTREFDIFVPSSVGVISIARAGDLAPGGPPQINSAASQSFDLNNWGIDNLLTYDKSIHDHNFDITLGYSIQKETASAERINASDLPSDEILNYSTAGEVSASNPIDYEWSLLAGFGRINYDYQSKYLAEVNFRREGSSRLGANNRYGNFPSGAVGWRISLEDFYPQDFLINEVLIRASLGKTGNNAIGNFDQLGRLTSIPDPNNLADNNNFVLGNSIVTGKALTSLSNSSLQWETALQYQIGVNLGLLNDRIRLKADYFNKTTDNMLFDVNLPRASGFASTRINIGKMENKGLEFEINSANVLKKDFQWSSNLNVSFLSNEVTEMPDQIDQIIFGTQGGTNITTEGEEVGALYGFERIGFFNSQEQLNDPNLVGWPGQKKLGAAIYKDQNGDGIINNQDRTVIGSPHPDVTFGFNNRLSYKNFSLSVLLTGMLGYEIMPATRDVDLNLVARWNVNELVLDRWRSPENPGAGFVPTSTVNPGSRQWMDAWLESGDHLWIKNVNLSYSLPQNILKSLGGIKALRFYMTVQNLARFDNFSGFNPEVSANGGDPLALGVDVYTYPLTRTYTMGVNFSF